MNYYHQLLKNSPGRAYYFELLKFYLDINVYQYGGHVKYSIDDRSMITRIRRKLRFSLRNLPYFFKRQNYNKSVISEAYFNINIDGNLKYPIFRASWNIWFERKRLFSRAFNNAYNTLASADFSYLISDEFTKELDVLIDEINSFLLKNKILFVVLPNDMTPINRIAIDACKNKNIPSAIFLHGIPGRYNTIDDARADYLFVYGKMLKHNYESIRKEGLNKVVVTGHPSYRNIKLGSLRSSKEDILVLSKSIDMTTSNSALIEHSMDRGSIIAYLHSIKNVLGKCGVKNVRLRLHPSENRNWYMRYMDNSFFTIDEDRLQESLKKSTLVIGPTSTVFFESLIAGVSYIVYEITENLANYKLAPPYDGSDTRVVIANNEQELKSVLDENRVPDVSIIRDYYLDDYSSVEIGCIIEKG